MNLLAKLGLAHPRVAGVVITSDNIAPVRGPVSPLGRKAIWAVCGCFLLKALLLAWFITPLWDIPDESAHLSYAVELAEDGHVPLLGSSLVREDIVRNWMQTEVLHLPVMNWVAQHPPVYYVGAATVWALGSRFISDREVLYRLPRIVSALAATLTLLVIFGTIRRVTGRESVALGVTACISCIPMFSHLAGGISNDTTVTLFFTLAVASWVSLLKTGHTSAAYKMAAWLALAGGTKMTALPMAVPLLAIGLLNLRGTWRQRAKHGVGVACLAFSLPWLWLLRNLVYFGDPFMTADKFFQQPNEPLSESLISFLSNQPVIEHLYRHFFAMMGWNGVGKGRLLLLQFDGFYLTAISALMAVVLALTLARHAWIASSQRKPLAVAAASISVINASAALLVLPHGHTGAYPVYSLVAGVLAFAILAIHPPADFADRLSLLSLVPIAFFVAVLSTELHNLYLVSHTVRATHGRYLFPLLSLMALGFVVPATRWRGVRGWMIGAAVALMATVEMLFYADRVIPFYSTGVLG